jgi:hypothetical protein
MHPKLPEVTALSTRFKRIQPKRLSRGFPYQVMPDCGMAFIYHRFRRRLKTKRKIKKHIPIFWNISNVFQPKNNIS